MRRLLVVVLACALTGLALAQPKPPDLPTINPTNAKLARTIEGLTSPATGLAFVEAGGLVVGSCEDGALRLWSRDQGKDLLVDARIQTLAAHKGTVTGLTAAGAVAVSAGMDGKLLVWNLPSDKPAHNLSAGAAVRAVGLSADGKVLASGGDDNAVQVWDVPGGKALRKLTGPTDWVMAVAVSPDGKLVAGGGHDGRLWLWEQGGKKVYDVLSQPAPAAKAPPPATNVVTALTFSPDGKTIALGGSDGKVYLFEASGAGKLLRTIQGHTGTVTSLTYHPGGIFLFSGSKDRTVRIWNAQTTGPVKSLEGHTAWVEGVTLADKGTLAVSISADRTVRVWDLGAVVPKDKKKK